MKTLEEGIHQTKPFKNEVRKAMVNVIYSGNTITHSLESYFGNFGLSQKQFNVLRILKGANGKISTAQVKERMLVKNADASRIVDRLINKGLLTKCPNAKDRRQIEISLTQEAHDLLAKIEQSLDELDRKIKGLSNEELIQLNYLLDKMRSNF